jgi:tellurite resistance protein
MPQVASQAHENAARVLAVIAVANGRVKDCELQTLEDLRAFAHLGISRRRFLQMARKGVEDVGERMNQRGYLHAVDYLYLDDLLQGVRDRGLRQLVCRLAAAVIAADGCVTASERASYRHMLLRWHLDTSTVDEAMSRDAPH